MELQKQSGLDFDDYLNRVLRLLVDNTIQNVQPLPESEFWQTLRQTSFCQPNDGNGGQQPMEHCNEETIEEDLADIHSLIASDIGAEPSQNFFIQPNNCSSPISTTASSAVAANSTQSSQVISHQHSIPAVPATSTYLNPKTCESENNKPRTSHQIQQQSSPIHPPPPPLLPLVKYGSAEQKAFSEKLERHQNGKTSNTRLDIAPLQATGNISCYGFDYSDPINGVDELAKLKRREKHKAPIDCSGVSENFGHTWFCKMCNIQHAGKHECVYYRNFHHPKYILKNSLHTNNGLPKELIYYPEESKRGSVNNKSNKESLNINCGGIYTGAIGLRAFTRLGPLRGRECAESEIDFDEDRSRVWLLYCENGTRKCIVATKR